MAKIRLAKVVSGRGGPKIESSLLDSVGKHSLQAVPDRESSTVRDVSALEKKDPNKRLSQSICTNQRCQSMQESPSENATISWKHSQYYNSYREIGKGIIILSGNNQEPYSNPSRTPSDPNLRTAGDRVSTGGVFESMVVPSLYFS